jgi:hypothetical protein
MPPASSMTTLAAPGGNCSGHGTAPPMSLALETRPLPAISPRRKPSAEHVARAARAVRAL